MDRKKAVELSQAAAQGAFSVASTKGLAPDAVVCLLLDLDDETGATVGRGLMPRESVAAEQKRASGAENVCLTNFMALRDLKMMARAMLPKFAAYIDAAPDAPTGTFRVLCFGDGGAEFFFVDLPVHSKKGVG